MEFQGKVLSSMPAIRLKVRVEDERHNAESNEGREDYLWGHIDVPCDPATIRKAAEREAIRLLREAYWDWDWKPADYPGHALVTVPGKTHPAVLREWLGEQTFGDLTSIVRFVYDLNGVHIMDRHYPWPFFQVMYHHRPQVVFALAVADSMFPAGRLIRKEIDLVEMRGWLDVLTTSAVNPSHAATLAALEARFGLRVPVPETPPKVSLQSGDNLIVASVRGLPRLTDRHEYTAAEIESATFTFSIWHVE